MGREIFRDTLGKAKRVFVEYFRTLYPSQSKTWSDLDNLLASKGDPYVLREE